MTTPERSRSSVDVDVAIVGAGPVGLVLGILLAQRDRSVVVLEQWPTPYTLPRAVHFDHEVGRILQSCGVADEVRAVSEPAEIYEWRNGQGATLLRFGRVGASLSGWPFSSMFCQPELEAVLRGRADSLPMLEVRPGVRVCGIEEHDDHVTVHHVSVQVGSDRRLVERRDATASVGARYAVGCDGANSTVRSLLDVHVDDRGFFYDWLIVDVILDEPTVFDPPNLQVCDPVRPTTAVSGGPGRRRWEFMRLPDESIDDLNRRVAGVGAAGPMGRAPGECPPRTARRLHVPGPRAASEVAGRPDLPRRRCRTPDAAVCRAGNVRRAPRRGEPGVEARPRAQGRAAARAPVDLRPGAPAERRRGDRLLHGAGQGDLCAGPDGGSGRATRRWLRHTTEV